MSNKYKFLYVLPFLVVGLMIGIILMHYYEHYKVQQTKKTNHDSKYSVEELERKVWAKGDINSYNRLQGVYRDGASGDFLFWAMYMANKYDYPKAYEDVYYSIEENYSPDSAIFEMDEKTRTLALHYLKWAAFKNDTSALDKIKELKAMNIPQDWLK
jgi:effector-binding domain-containing protein